jgi:hypothetical protein
MNAKRCLVFAIVLALLLPTTASASAFFWSPVSGTVQFVGGGAEKSFDGRIGPYYSMPLTGGEVTMRLGAYSWFLRAIATDAQEPPPEEGLLPPPFNLPPLSWVRVRIYDREDASRVLYEFDGNMEAFLSQPGIEVKFSGPYGVLITKSVTVPEGRTWWRGQLEAFAGVQRGHCDVDLIQGGLQAWIDAHGGTW